MDILVFDLDGTIVDSTKPIFRSLNHALAVNEMEPIGPDELRRHVGPPLHESLSDLVRSRGADESAVEPLIDAYRTEYETLSIELASAYPGIPAVLTALAARARLGVATSKPVRYARPILDTLGLSSLLSVIEGPWSGESEAKSTTLGRALERLGAVPGESPVWMIGDRRHDIAAGRALGIRTAGVTWGFGTRVELETAGAVRIADHPSELTSLVEAEN